MKNTSELNSFFYPNSVCVIGATENPSKIGSAITRNVNENPFQNYIPYFVSRSQPEILGQKTYKTICDIQDPIELAIILVPARFVASVVDECIQKPVKAIIIVTAGFGEMGSEGKKIESNIAKNAEMRISD